MTNFHFLAHTVKSISSSQQTDSPTEGHNKIDIEFRTTKDPEYAYWGLGRIYISIIFYVGYKKYVTSSETKEIYFYFRLVLH